MTLVRYMPLVRCLRLAAFLAGRRRLPALSVMAREVGVSERTIRRYLASLEEARWPVPSAAEEREHGAYGSEEAVQPGITIKSRSRQGLHL